MKRTMTKKQRISLAAVSVLLSALLAVSVMMVFRDLSARQKEKEDFEELAELVQITPPEPIKPDETPALIDDEPEETLRDLSELFAENDECIGWLCIPDTAVNYPVMYTPNAPQKYLRRNFYGEYSQSGVPFLDYRCSPDSGDLLIYGHNMKNGTMFSDLKKYLDADFLSSHQTIELQIANSLYRYTVTEIKVTDTSDKWYEDIGKNLFVDKRFLVLSTCYGGGNGRLLIIAVKDN